MSMGGNFISRDVGRENIVPTWGEIPWGEMSLCSEPRGMSYEIEVMSYKLKATSYEIQATSSEIRDTSD
jgi:hypothetical protein